VKLSKVSSMGCKNIPAFAGRQVFSLLFVFLYRQRRGLGFQTSSCTVYTDRSSLGHAQTTSRHVYRRVAQLCTSKKASISRKILFFRCHQKTLDNFSISMLNIKVKYTLYYCRYIILMHVLSIKKTLPIDKVFYLFSR